jgi:hypothetical protein
MGSNGLWDEGDPPGLGTILQSKNSIDRKRPFDKVYGEGLNLTN